VAARTAVFEAISRERTGRRRKLYSTLAHAITSVGLLAIIIDSSTRLGPALHAALSGVVIGVWVCFALVLATRVWIAPEIPGFASATPQRIRIAYLLTPDGVIDVVAAAALPLAWAFGLGQHDAELFAIVWTLKYIRESTGLSLLLRVMQRSLPALLSVVTVFFVIFLVSATLSYIVERRAQPNEFGSIPLAMWWAIVTLTTTGYGDVVPVTAWGRVLAGLVMMSGLVTFALWAGIIANAFTEELRRRHFLQVWNLVTRVPFFRDLGAAAIADIVRLLQSQDASPGNIIIREGDPGDSMYFIVDGEVAIEVKPHPVKLGPGEFFGEMALIFGAPRSATVMVTKPSILLVLDIADFRVLAGRRPELTDVIEAEGKRRRAANLAAADDSRPRV
jgi:voltage-gated potassium channel